MFEEDNGIEQLTAFLEAIGFMIAESETKNNSSEDSKFVHKVRRIRSTIREQNEREDPYSAWES